MGMNGAPAAGPPAAPPPPAPQALAAARNRAFMRSGASWFFWIAALSLINSVLFWASASVFFVVGLGLTEAANEVGHDLITGTTGMVAALLFDVLLAAGFAGLGYMARQGAGWAFIVGMAVYTLDALLLLWVADWLSVAFHALALFFLVRGYIACRALAVPPPPTVTTGGIAPPIVPR